MCSFAHLLFRSLARSFVSSLSRLFVCPFCPFVHLFVCSLGRSFVRPLPRLFVFSNRLLVCSFVRLSLCSFIRSFVRSFVHLFVGSVGIVPVLVNVYNAHVYAN